MNEVLHWLLDAFNAQIPVGSSSLLVREVVGNVFGGMFSFWRLAITALALSSFGVTTALMFLWAVYCWSNVVAATDGVHVPAGSPTLT